MIAAKLKSLKKNTFRSSFKLTQPDLEKAKSLIEKNDDGTLKYTKLQSDCIQIICTRLSPANPKNDGKQTPYKGHPVFVAQHATATCCRSCLMKWHGITKGKDMTKDEIFYVCKLIRSWIQLELY